MRSSNWTALVDRQSALSNAVTGLSRTHSFGPEIEQWLLAELADRANPADFIQLRTAYGLTEDPAQLWQEYVDRMAAAVTCRPDVLEGLVQLRTAEWTIGIATNGASNIQRAKLRTTGISELVDGIAVSGDVQVRKPDRQLFHLAAARCGKELADGAWMIGGNPADVEGGRQAGLHTIWLRGRPWPETIPAPHHAAHDVTEAITFLLNKRE
ncbi:HAD family hydrolase [Streptomyces aureoversilis]|uniref:HAD family hydrolase n=1 Tax=Streptomyces aureoversilis TaxID=67277 RepID=A0ABW0A8S1_9ACTN